MCNEIPGSHETFAFDATVQETEVQAEHRHEKSRQVGSCWEVKYNKNVIMLKIKAIQEKLAINDTEIIVVSILQLGEVEVGTRSCKYEKI